MAIYYGTPSDGRERQWSVSDLKVASISAPLPGGSYGSPILVTYALDSDRSTAASTVEVQYSTNSGSSWSNATADTSHASHSGTSSLAADPDTETYTFVWNSLTDLSAAFDASVRLRVRASDGSNYGAYLESGDFTVSFIANVSFGSFSSSLGSTILVPYTVNTSVTGGTYSIQVDYSTNDGTSWSTATAETSHSSHNGVSGLSSATSYNYVWDAEADLGASFNASILLRIRASNGTAYGEYTQSGDLTVSMLPTIAITGPATDTTQGAPVYITYNAVSNRDSPSLTATVTYSTNSGSTFTSATAKTTDSSHSGVSGLSPGALTFVWDSANDVGVTFQGSTNMIRIVVSDGTNTSAAANSAIFQIDMLPSPPSLISPADGYFDTGTDAKFVFTVPADAGSDRLVFKWEMDNDDDFSSPTVSRDSVAYYTRFRHRVNQAQSTKNGASGISHYVYGLSATSSSQALTYASLTDYYTESTLPTTLTNPQILLINRADRRAFINPSTISSTGFTISKSAVGIDENALVDLLIFSGAASSFTTYWVDLTLTANSTSYTLGTAPFQTDLLGNTIPSGITNIRPEILEGSDWGVYVSAVNSHGFTLKRSVSGVADSAVVRVCLRSDPSTTYQHQSLTVSSVTDTSSSFPSVFDDDTDGSASWPDYVPGTILNITNQNDRNVILGEHYSDIVNLKKSKAGADTNGDAVIHGFSESNTKTPYWSRVSPNGVPDSFEGDHCRYEFNVADDPADGTYSWRATAGNVA